MFDDLASGECVARRRVRKLSEKITIFPQAVSLS